MSKSSPGGPRRIPLSDRGARRSQRNRPSRNQRPVSSSRNAGRSNSSGVYGLTPEQEAEFMRLQMQNLPSGSAGQPGGTDQLSQAEIDALMQQLQRGGSPGQNPRPMHQLPQQGQFFDRADLSDAEIAHIMQLYGQQPVSPAYARPNTAPNADYDQLVPREGYAIPYRRPAPLPPPPTGLAKWMKRYRDMRQRAEASSMWWWALKLFFGAVVGLPLIIMGIAILIANRLFLDSSVVIALFGSLFLVGGIGYLGYYALAPLLQKWVVNVPDKHYFVVVQNGIHPVEYLPAGLWHVPFRFNARVIPYVDFAFVHVKDTYLNLFQGAGPRYDLEIGVMLAFNPVYADPRNYRRLMTMRKPADFRRDVLRVVYDALWQYLGPFSLLDWKESLEQRPSLTYYLADALRDLAGLGLTPGNSQPVTVFVRGLDDVNKPPPPVVTRPPVPESLVEPPIQDDNLTQPSAPLPASMHELPPEPAPRDREWTQPAEQDRRRATPLSPAESARYDRTHRRDPDLNSPGNRGANDNRPAPAQNNPQPFAGDDLADYFPTNTFTTNGAKSSDAGRFDDDFAESDTIGDVPPIASGPDLNDNTDDSPDDSADQDVVRRHQPPRRNAQGDTDTKRKGSGARDARPNMPWVRGRPDDDKSARNSGN